MSLLDLRRNNSDLKQLIQKVRKLPQQKVSTSKSTSIIDRIKNACNITQQKLGDYADKFELIQTQERLHEYFVKCIENKVISVDTETTGLDSLNDEIVGICIYTPDEKPAYIPMNHKSCTTKVRVSGQLDNEQVKQELEFLKNSDTQFIWFNGKFDIKFIRHYLGVDLPCHWDGFIAAMVLKEDEIEHNLKYLWTKYIANEEEPVKFELLFSGITFDLIPFTTGYLYAAKDALMTYQLYELQKHLLAEDDPMCIEKGYQRLAKLYKEIELPLVRVIADIEDTGIGLDLDYTNKLKDKYHKLAKEREQNVYDIINTFKDKIIAYKSTHPNTKLQDPINISSSVQIAELLYDILQIEPVSHKKPRGTGEEILTQIDHPISKAILEYREIQKLLTTYIDKLPNVVNKKTNRVHCLFKQIGAGTGRTASSDPNLQNIPAKNKDIRPMFVAPKGYVLLGADYSQQEPKITADMSNDQVFIEHCKQGLDAYAIIASVAFNRPYEDCLEFKPDGTTSKQGKYYRGLAKIILLGICYGKSINSIAKDLDVTLEKATEIYNAVLNSLPGLKQFMIDSEEMARKNGWVETKWGRRRHIPDMMLPQYEIKSKGALNFDPFFDSEELGVKSDIELIQQKYINDLKSAVYKKQKQAIKDKASKAGFIIIDHTTKIEEATRKCVNSRIQGSAADQTKIAMRLIADNPRLQELGFKMVLLVHDEIIGIVPIDSVKEAAGIFQQCMINAAADLKTGAKCDMVVSKCWTGPDIDIKLSTEEIHELVGE